MRILIHSNGPMVQSGYGTQVRLLLPQLRDLGHDVAVSAFYGLSGSPIKWDGFDILPAGMSDFGVDTIIPHALEYQADLVLTLMDFWKLGPVAHALRQQPFKLAAWLPTDCHPLGTPDRVALQASGARPIAMSRFGQDTLTRAGFTDVPYIPHMVDTDVFKPPADRQAIRDELGIEHRFVIGICAANRDALRKGWPEQLDAFAQFHRRRPESLLMIHTTAVGPAGFDIPNLVEDFGIQDSVIISDQYAQVAGLMSPAMMAEWFGALDVLSSCSYAEAFGVPIIEAQACGVPVIATDASAMSELATPDLLVKGSPFWNPVHRAWWTRPDVDRIIGRYERVWRDRNTPVAMRSVRTREFAEGFNPNLIGVLHWEPFLKSCEDGKPTEE